MNKKLKLAFSGGGFRATFYCLGAFRRLVELGLWKNVCRIDSVSGGSITAGAIMAALADGEFKDINDFDKRVKEPLKRLGKIGFREKIVTLPLLLLSLLSLVFGIYIYFLFENVTKFDYLVSLALSLILAINLFIILFATILRHIYSQRLEFFLNKLLFKNKSIQSLPAYPEWSVNTACLNTGKRFRFKQELFGDYLIGDTSDNYNVKVSFTVASSAAFPLVFAPIEFDLKNKFGRKFIKDERYTENIRIETPEKVYLTDGGVYDNLGSENIIKGDLPFIILDAGGNIATWSPDVKPNWFKRNKRILDVALDQLIALRRRLIFKTNEELNRIKEYGGVMLILGRPVSHYWDSPKFLEYGKLSNQVTQTQNMPNYQFFSEEIDKLVADIRTDLDIFDNVEIEMLMWAGAVRIDLTMKRFLKHLFSQAQFLDIPQRPDFKREKIEKVLRRRKGFLCRIFSFIIKIKRGLI